MPALTWTEWYADKPQYVTPEATAFPEHADRYSFDPYTDPVTFLPRGS